MEQLSLGQSASADGRNDDFRDAGAAWAAAQLAWDMARCFCLWAIIAIKEFAYVCKASQMQPHLKSIGKSYSDKSIKSKPHARTDDMTCYEYIIVS